MVKCEEHGRCWDKDSICEHLYVDLSRSIFGPIKCVYPKLGTFVGPKKEVSE